MAVLNPEETTSAQWDYIVSILKAEMTGGGGANRLTGVKAVTNSLSLWTEFVPAVGVQLMDFQELSHSTKNHLLQSTFVIQISAQSTQATATANGFAIPCLDDAMKQVRALMSDGAGNGVASIIRDPANRTVGGFASKMSVTGAHFQPEIQPGSENNGTDPTIWAHVFLDVTTVQFVAIA